ncbi:hypothetical protein KSS87_016677 [Heliosperma pusillum]|nr:hypothetical protein KSS87_016677 [Heliosperma pusillum]
MAEPTAAFMAESETRGITASASAFVNNVQAQIPDIEKGVDIVAALQVKKGTGEIFFLVLFSHCALL